MKKNKIFTLLLGIAAIVLVGIVVVLDPPFMDNVNRYPNVLLSGYPDTGSYEFNPETIFGSLDRGKIDVFLSPPEIPAVHTFSSALSWNQDDYLRIASVLHQYVWKETLEDWSVYSMIFNGDCRYDPLGFDIVEFTYFKIVGIRKYTAHKIDIFPLSGGINWGGGTTYPLSLFDRWKSMDLKRYKVTAEDALQVAEENGGRDMRMAVKNECRIHVSLGDPGWSVYYQDKGTNIIFEMQINPYTGKYKILNPHQ